MNYGRQFCVQEERIEQALVEPGSGGLPSNDRHPTKPFRKVHPNVRLACKLGASVSDLGAAHGSVVPVTWGYNREICSVISKQ
jgi:hypothetical protein